MKERPSEAEALKAEHILSEMILKFSDEARAPRERGTPMPNPVWRPRPSTLRYSYIRGGGWAWLMNADDQTTAYYIAPTNQEPFGKVTCHGQDRHNFDQLLVAKHIHCTYVPWLEWYDYKKRYELDNAYYEAKRGQL